jgi:hypothetical protein
MVRVVEKPLRAEPQEKNRYRFWGEIQELEGRFLREFQDMEAKTCRGAQD